MESKQKDKKHSPTAVPEIINDQLGENASGVEKENDVYKKEHASKTKKR